jgi:uncharacterized membrane protein YwaF
MINLILFGLLGILISFTYKLIDAKQDKQDFDFKKHAYTSAISFLAVILVFFIRDFAQETLGFEANKVNMILVGMFGDMLFKGFLNMSKKRLKLPE